MQLIIEYDPQPPGRIDWDTVDRDWLTPALPSLVQQELADSPGW